MIIYEVNIKISSQIYKKFNAWLDQHILLMMNYEGFIKFKKYSIVSSSENYKKICIHYFITGMELFDNYISKYSYKMRNDSTLEQFKGEFSITRRILSEI